MKDSGGKNKYKLHEYDLQKRRRNQWGCENLLQEFWNWERMLEQMWAKKEAGGKRKYVMLKNETKNSKIDNWFQKEGPKVQKV